MKRTAMVLTVAACIAFCSCNKLDLTNFIYAGGPDVNERFELSMKYLESNPVAQFNASSNEYRMYLVTDIHHDGKNDRLGNFVSACLDDKESEKVVICLGDIVNGKGYHKQISDKLKPLSDAGWTFFTALGNHDTYFREWPDFRKYWPLSTFSFSVNTPDEGSDLFICLDSADGTFGTSQRRWLEEQLKDAQGQHRNIYVFTHTNFFNTDNTQLTSGNYPLEESFDIMSLFAAYGVDYVLTGHDHYFELCRFSNVNYYSFNALCNKPAGSYYVLNLSSEFRFEERHVGL